MNELLRITKETKGEVLMATSISRKKSIDLISIGNVDVVISTKQLKEIRNERANMESFPVANKGGINGRISSRK